MIFPTRNQLIRDLSLTRTDQMEISKRRGDPHSLERVNKEIRRRTQVVGIFPNEASVLRLTSAVSPIRSNAEPRRVARTVAAPIQSLLSHRDI